MLPVYTAEELQALPLVGTAKPARLAVIGNPIAHSRSPQMQQAALDALGEPTTYIRLLAGRGEGEFEQLVHRVQQLGFVGVNVTVPFKKQAFALADRADALSALCGAANTLRFTAGGDIEAANTDGPGFEQAIAELCVCPLGQLRALILGACGGAGSALAAQAVLSGCPQLTLANRPRPELGQLAGTLQPHVQPGCQLRTVSMADRSALAAAVAEADLIVNATSLGLHEGDPLPLDPAWLRPGQAVCDIVPHDTPLRRAAAERGCRACDGTSMLLWQGAWAYKLWYGQLPPVEAMRAALLRA